MTGDRNVQFSLKALTKSSASRMKTSFSFISLMFQDYKFMYDYDSLYLFLCVLDVSTWVYFLGNQFITLLIF